MIKTKSLLILIFSLLFSNYHLSFSEELTITTYYPSPVGIYKELRAKKMAIGEDYYYNPSSYCWEGSCTTSIDDNADLVVEGNVGIGTVDPLEKLDVNGGIRVDDYIKARDSGGLSLKTDDGTTRLFIKDNGDVGIGTTNPGKKLEVAGSTKIGGDLNVNGDTQLGNASSDKTTVKGDLNVNGDVQLGDSSSDKTTVKGDLEVKGKLRGLGCNDGDYLRYDAAKDEWVCADPPGSVKELFTGAVGCGCGCHTPGCCCECTAKSFTIPSDAKKIIVFIVIFPDRELSAVIKDAKIIYQDKVVWGPKTVNSPGYVYDSVVINGNGGGTLEFRETSCFGVSDDHWWIGVSYVY